MQFIDCPSKGEWEAFGSGSLPLDRLDEMATHLDSCEACLTVVQAFAESSAGIDAELARSVSPYVQEPGRREAVDLMRLAAALPIDELTPVRDDELKLPMDLGQYRLISKLGQGGMGAVYAAEHLLLKRPVAVKLLSKTRIQSARAASRFRREIEAIGKLDHPNIVRATDAGEAAGTHFLVMELVAGEDMQRIVRRAGALPVGTACEVIRQAAVALQHVHQHGLVHRDVKPVNLMVTSAGQVKLLDLGLALLRQLDSDVELGLTQLTEMGLVVGTLDYMAPEQAGDSRNVDIRADIYSLGCSLYHLLAGRPPFPGGTAAEKLIKHAQSEPPPLTTLRTDAPSRLSEILARSMAKSPADRYQTPGEMAQALAPLARRLDAASFAPPPATVPPTHAPPVQSTVGISLQAADTEDPLAAPARLDLRVAAGGQTNSTASFPELDTGPRQSKTSSRPWLVRHRPGILVAAGLATLLLAAVVILVRTRHGTLQITIDGQDAGTISVKADGEVELKDPADGKLVRVTVDAGAKMLKFHKEGFDAVGTSFDLATTAGRRIEVKFIPTPPAAPVDKIARAPANEREFLEWFRAQGGKGELDVGGRAVLIHEIEPLPASTDIIVSLDLQSTTIPIDAFLDRMLKIREIKRFSFQGRPMSDAQLQRLAQARCAPHVKRLNLMGTRVTDAGLASLPSFPRLHTLEVHDLGIGDATLAALARCDPQWIAADGNPAITDDGLAQLAGCHQLKMVYVGGASIHDEGLASLVRLKLIEDLNLSKTMVTGAGLAMSLPAWPALRQLRINVLNLDDAPEFLVALGSCRQLELLSLAHNPLTDACVPHLESLTKLGEVTLTGTKITSSGVDRLRQALPACRIISDHGEFGPAETEVADRPPAGPREFVEWFLSTGGRVDLYDGEANPLADNVPLPTGDFDLDVVDLKPSRIAIDEVLDRLATITDIGSLEVDGLPFTDAHLSRLAGLPCAGEMWGLNLAATKVTQEGLAQCLPSFPRLSTISVQNLDLDDGGLETLESCDPVLLYAGENPRITDAGARFLARFPKLRDLGLGESAIHDAGLAALESLSSLEYLGLEETLVSPRGVAKSLPAWPRIKNLGLDSLQFDDQSTAALASCAELVTLSLQYNPLTDECVPHLAKLSTLTLLKIVGTSITAAGVDRLRQALPNCLILSDHGTFEPAR